MMPRLTVRVDGRDIAFAEYGSGDQVVVLLHAFLQDHRMQGAIGAGLAARGRRAIALNLLADGVADPALCDAPALARQVRGALDALGVSDPVVFLGTSLGSSVAMEITLQEPSRVAGLVLEGPFLEDSMRATALGWSAMYGAYALGAPLLRLVARAGRRLPAGSSVPLDMLRHMLVQDPARAAAFVQGQTFGRTGPPRDERRTIQAPALVIGFPLDPFHRLADAEQLADDLPHAQLRRIRSIADLRFQHDDLLDEIAGFCAHCTAAPVPATTAG